MIFVTKYTLHFKSSVFISRLSEINCIYSIYLFSHSFTFDAESRLKFSHLMNKLSMKAFFTQELFEERRCHRIE